MPKNPKAFAVDDRVVHAVYGHGTITQTNWEHTIIDFDEGGKRKFLTEKVSLEVSDVIAPAKPVRAKKPKVAKVPKVAKAAK